jgi:pyruvate dehydrogenase E2 component (dihydrolipoyllysine-residue acetyltransferase)
MPTNVVMPQMGESIAEGTIVRWIKKVGDSVDRDEPLFEISTDKVDAEIPSPAAGVVTDIRVKEGETVPVNSVVAIIGAVGEAPAVAPPEASSTARSAGPQRPDAGGRPLREAPPDRRGGGAAARPRESVQSHAREFVEALTDLPEAAVGQPEAPGEAALSKDELRKQKSSPLVRRIAKEHNVDLQLIKGTGISGRVTKDDILGYIESGAPNQTSAGASSTSSGHAPSAGGEQGPRAVPQQAPGFRPGENVRIEPMSVMRKKIAEHMVLSAQTSPHVYSVYEVNCGRVAALRDKYKAQFETAGAKLTFTAFIAKVIVDALRQFPVVNASVDGTNIIYKKDINLGIAVALDNGLIVPVIRNADEKNLLGLARAINDVGARARSKRLNPDEVQNGTFTITNPGIFGALYGLPLINQPQVAILGVGAIEKRAVVIEDAIAIRPMCHLTLGYDHRLIDGAEAGRFLSFVKERLEHFDERWM